MSTMALFGLDGLRYLDEQSDRNLVYFFKIELERINKQQFTNLSGHNKKRLIKRGIILYTKPGIWELSQKGQRLLYSIQQEHKH
jgi:hypothetical protein